DPLLRQCVESVKGKDDIPVLLKAGAIKVRRDMTHHQIVGRDVVGDDAVIPSNGTGIPRGDRKGTVITAVQARRRDKGDAPLRQRWACHPGLGIERWACHRQEGSAHSGMDLIKSGHRSPFQDRAAMARPYLITRTAIDAKKGEWFHARVCHIPEGEGTALVKRANVSYSNACSTTGRSHGCRATSLVQAPYVAMVMGRVRASVSRRASTACKMRPVKGVYRKKNVPSV